MTEVHKIPKIVHYCWFGKANYNLLIKRCIASWHYHLSDYKFILWNEDNFDINSHPFTKAAYTCKKYAFVSDYVRMHALNEHGGIYLDTDVEVFKSFNDLLENRLFIGLEDIGRFGTSTIGSSKRHWLPAEMLELYNDLQFSTSNIKKLVNVNLVSNALLSHGFSADNHLEIIANQCKLPIGSFSSASRNFAKPLTVYADHLYDGSWNKSNKSGLSKLSKYIFKGGIRVDIESIAKLIKYKK